MGLQIVAYTHGSNTGTHEVRTQGHSNGDELEKFRIADSLTNSVIPFSNGVKSHSPTPLYYPLHGSRHTRHAHARVV